MKFATVLSLLLAVCQCQASVTMKHEKLSRTTSRVVLATLQKEGVIEQQQARKQQNKKKRGLLDSVNMSPAAGKGTARDQAVIDTLLAQTNWHHVFGNPTGNFGHGRQVPDMVKHAYRVRRKPTQPPLQRAMEQLVRDLFQVLYVSSCRDAAFGFQPTDRRWCPHQMDSVRSPSGSFAPPSRLVQSHPSSFA